MKGRMDVLNFKKQPSSSPQTKHFRTETVVSYEEDVIKIEPDEEQEKENCEDVSDSSDFVIDNVNALYDDNDKINT